MGDNDSPMICIRMDARASYSPPTTVRKRKRERGEGEKEKDKPVTSQQLRNQLTGQPTD